jgi:hypothetical protein
LHEIGILTAEETEQFATALWSRVDETGLPAETLMRRNAILLLPEPSPGLAKDKLKTYLLSTDFYGRANKMARETKEPHSVLVLVRKI